MNLLFVIKTLAQQGGGAERVLAEVTAELVARGHEVRVVSFDPPGSSDFYALHPQVVRERLPLGDVRRPSGVASMGRRILALRRMMRGRRVDAAVGFMHSAYIPLALAGCGTGVPVVASEHTVYRHYADRPFERMMVAIAAFMVRQFTGVTEAVRDEFPPRVRRKMSVIANPVSASPVHRADVAASGTKVLLTVGSLTALKDQATLIKAFARLAPAFPDWHLRVVGDGPLRTELRALVRELRLDARVSLPGATSDVESEYLAAHLFAIPSRYESFGIATAEALAHGLPVVGFADCMGTRMLITHGDNGMLVQGADRVGGLADALGELMRSPEHRLRMGQAGPARVAAFSPVRVAAEWETLLERLSFGHRQATLGQAQ